MSTGKSLARFYAVMREEEAYCAIWRSGKGIEAKASPERSIAHCLAALAKAGIKKCNTFVLDSNVDGRYFWKHMGWQILENNYRTMQIPTRKD